MTHDPFTDDTFADDDQFTRLLSSRLNEQLVVPAERQERVTAAARQAGRRRVRTRRIAAGAAVAAVAAGTVAVAPQLSHGSGTVQVAGQPSASARPSASSSVAVTRASATPSVRVSKGSSPAYTPRTQLIAAESAILKRHLAGFSVTLTPTSDGGDVVGEARDAAGRAWVGGGTDQPDPTASYCSPRAGCRVISLKGGTVYITSSGSDKAGDGHWYYYVRPGKPVVWFGQVNAFQGNGPVTRPTIPLNQQQVFSLLSDPRWSTLVPQGS